MSIHITIESEGEVYKLTAAEFAEKFDSFLGIGRLSGEYKSLVKEDTLDFLEYLTKPLHHD